MKKIESSKIILGIILSIVMILTLSSFSAVHADDKAWPNTIDSNENTENTKNTSTSQSSVEDDDPFANISSENWSTPELENSVSNTQTNNTSSNSTNNSVSNTDIVFNTTSNNTVNSLNSTTSNSNSLAKTGIEDSNGMFAVILVVCGIAAVYSFKKISDYKNM